MNKDKQIPMDDDLWMSLHEFACTESEMICAFPPRHMGGTGFCNFNNNNEDGRALAVVMRECRKVCDCLFLAPIPIAGVTPFEVVFGTPSTEYAARIVNANGTPPKTISVHQYAGGGNVCVNLFKQLMVQELCTVNPGNIQVSALVDATQILDKVMNK